MGLKSAPLRSEAFARSLNLLFEIELVTIRFRRFLNKAEAFLFFKWGAAAMSIRDERI